MNIDQREQKCEPLNERRASQWLSSGLEALIARLSKSADRSDSIADFDVVVVGSGYGGAVAAAELARYRGRDKSVCVSSSRRRSLLPP